jgi:hypothetical protein
MPNILSPTDMAYVEIESPFAQVLITGQAAGTDTVETAFGLIGPGPLSLDLGAVQIHPNATNVWTAGNTNYFTITVNKRTAAAPGTAVPMAIGTAQLAGTGNGMGSGTAWKASSLFIQSGVTLLPGDALTYAITHTGSGLTYPQLFLGLYLKGR